jgi:16S rRNA C967 or C1407 C5-methylase (RsmB/RsmF family)
MTSRDDVDAAGERTTPLTFGGSLELHEGTLEILQSMWAASGDNGLVRLDAILHALTTPPSAMTCRYDPHKFGGSAAEAVKALRIEVAAAELDALNSVGGPAHRDHAGNVDAASSAEGDEGEDAVVSWEPTPHGTIPDVLVIPCHGRQDDLRPEPKEVVVGLLCGMAVLRGAPVFAPGVFAIATGVIAGDCVSVWADVDGVCLRGTSAAFVGRKVFVGNGVVTQSRVAFFRDEAPTGVYVAMTSPLYATPRFGGSALFVLQNAPSCCAGHELAVDPGLTVLDMCAAPGGKTAHIATLMAGRGTLVALERSAKRATTLRDMMAKQFPWVEVRKMDAVKVISGKNGFAAGHFDRVLLDAPCTGLGQRPRLRQSVLPAEMLSIPRLQRKLLATGAMALKPGGLLVYSTCTINAFENEAVVAWALGEAANLGLELMPPRNPVGHPGLHGQGLTPDQCLNVQRFDPSRDSTMIGFFVARFRKRLS